MGAKRVVAALLVLLLGACAPEPTDPHEPVEQSKSDRVVPAMHDGRFRLLHGVDVANSLYTSLETTNFADELTTGEITSISFLDYVQYWDLVTKNTTGTEADIYLAAGMHFSFETTTGSGYGNHTFYSDEEFDSVESHGMPMGLLIATKSPPGDLEVYAWNGCAYSFFGTINYWKGGTGFRLDTESGSLSYARDDMLPSHEDAMVSCGTADHRCNISERPRVKFAGVTTIPSWKTMSVILPACPDFAGPIEQQR